MTRPLLEAAVGRQRLLDRQDRLALGKLILRQPRRLAGGQMAGGDHQKHRLAEVMHLAGREQRLVMRRGRAIGHARRNPRAVQTATTPGAARTGVKVERGDLAARRCGDRPKARCRQSGGTGMSST